MLNSICLAGKSHGSNMTLDANVCISRLRVKTSYVMWLFMQSDVYYVAVMYKCIRKLLVSQQKA